MIKIGFALVAAIVVLTAMAFVVDDLRVHEAEDATSCPVELQIVNAHCAQLATGLYEYDFFSNGGPDDRKSWCRRQGSKTWCSTPVKAAP